MRNILQYPITYDEKLKVLENLREKILDDYRHNIVIGDMKAAILQEVINDIKRLYNEKVGSSHE